MVDFSRSRPVMGVDRCHTAAVRAQLRRRRRSADRRTTGRAPRASRRRPAGARGGSWPTRPARRRWPRRRRGPASRGAEPANGAQVTRSPWRATSSSGLAPTSAVAGVAAARGRQVGEIGVGRRVVRRRGGRTMVRASSGPSATNRSARASTTLCRPLAGILQPLQRRGDPGAVLVGLGQRLARSAPWAARAAATPAARRGTATACGRISAAGLDMSNGKAPKMIGALCDASAARASAMLCVGGVHAVGDDGAAAGRRGRRSARGSRRHGRVGGWPVSPECAESGAPRVRSRTPRSTPPPSRTGCPRTRGSSTQRVTTAREKCPCPTNTTSRDSMCSSASAMARSARSLTCCGGLAAGAAVRPHQPVGHGLADLAGWSCPRSRRNPIR